MAEISWTLQALEALDAIAEFISRQSSPYAASFIERSFERVQILKRFPLSGRIVPEIESIEIRELILDRRYRIIYRVISEEMIHILTVHSTAHPLPDTASWLESDE